MYSDAKKFITSTCLIASDIDKTLLNVGSKSEEGDFVLNVAPELLKIALAGTNIAVVTGNSFGEISSRFFRFLFNYLVRKSKIEVLSKFHFFCNSGGVYFHINDEDLKLLKNEGPGQQFFDLENPNSIKSKFIFKSYLDRTEINTSDIEKIKEVLEIVWNDYLSNLENNIMQYKAEYYIDKEPEKDSESVQYPINIALDGSDHVDIRYLYFEDRPKSTVQITLKPVLSWKYAVEPGKKINADIRKNLIDRIHERFDLLGLTSYTASAGGNSSIDVTKSKINKAYAIRFLVDHLGIEGNERKGEKFGSNVIYMGDEVLSGGGNDFPLTKIDGVLVLAVNKIPKHVPFKSRVIIPNPKSGPEATSLVLSLFNKNVKSELKRWERLNPQNDFPQKNAIKLFKEKWFSEKINGKIKNTFTENKLSTEELQILYTFITLIHRNDESAKKWTNILVNELDEIMEALDDNELERFSGIGSSYPKESIPD